MVMIEKMKFLSITGPKTDIDRMTETYLSKYEIHLENALSELTEVASLSPFLEINPYREALSTIDSFYEQLENPSQLIPEPMDTETAIFTVRAIQDGFRRLEEEKSRLQSEHAEIIDPLKIIRPFRNLNFDVSQILKLKNSIFRNLKNISMIIWILYLSNAAKMICMFTVFISYRNIRHTKYMPFILPCTLNVFLSRMNIRELQ